MGFIQDFKNLATSDIFIKDTKEIVMNEIFHQATESFLTIVPGIKGGQQVAAMRGFEYVTKASAGCGGNGISPTFPAFSQKWNPKLAEVKIEYCYSDFENSFLQWGLKNGYQRKDLTGTEMAVFIQDLISKAMALDLQRIVLLSDKDIAEQEILTDVEEKSQFYDIIDKGLLPTLAYLKTLPEFEGQFFELEKNTGTVAEQMALANDYAVKKYEELLLETYEFDGDILLSSNKLVKNYEAFLRRQNGYNIQGNLDATVNGVKSPKIDGVDITPVVNFDRWKKTDFTIDNGNGGLTIHQPHFALFTRKEFLQVGIDDAASLENITLEYIGGKEETFWIKANYMVDFKMTNPYAFKAIL
jgi:hypothetical protein